MEIVRVSKNAIDGNGQEYISVYLEERTDEAGQLHSRYVSFENNHIKQKCTVTLWSRNPHRLPHLQMDRELGVFKGEVLSEGEAVAFVRSLNFIKEAI